MARPPKDPADKTDERVTVGFTQEERKWLDWLTVHLRARSAGEVLRRALKEMYERHVKSGR